MSERCRVKTGWPKAGREGLFLLTVADEPLGQPWAIVVWDGEEDPDCFKAAGLEIIQTERRGLGFSEDKKASLIAIGALVNDDPYYAVRKYDDED